MSSHACAIEPFIWETRMTLGSPLNVPENLPKSLFFNCIVWFIRQTLRTHPVIVANFHGHPLIDCHSHQNAPTYVRIGSRPTMTKGVQCMLETCGTWMQLAVKIQLQPNFTVTWKRVSLDFHCHWKSSDAWLGFKPAILCASIGMN